MTPPFYLVAGLGKTGLSIARYLRRRNCPFIVFDSRSEVDGFAEFTQEFPEIDVFFSQLPKIVFQQLTGIIASPGLAMDDEVFQHARRLHIPIFGDVECFAREVQVPVVAITGTNGKSTVTTLVGEMAKAAGLSVAVAGNIGTPVLDLLDNGEHYDLWVLELSSFQLDLTETLAPIAATILNISPDHLDRHHTLSAYTLAKHRIYRQAKTLIHNREDKATYPQEKDGAFYSFGLNPPAACQWGIASKEGELYFAYGEHLLMPVKQLRIKGRQNWQNALAAAALAKAAGIANAFICSVLQTFAGLPHRCQWVRQWQGIDWINDSKGTNIGATISAISGIGEGLNGKVILIAGGIGKGADFTELRPVISTYVRALVLIGQDAPLIETALTGCTSIQHASSLEEAIACAKNLAVVGDIVLLSPACASQDMFHDFNHRGESFTQLVNLL
jgi:UDP-N-acetylmuramoylalanine--D-glutamate ligase